MNEVGSFAAQAYVLDSGHRTTLQNALDPVISRLRSELEADLALVLYQPYELGGLVRALASSAQQLADMPLANEPLLLSQRMPTYLLSQQIFSRYPTPHLLLKMAAK